MAADLLVTSARLSELLNTIEASVDVLRSHIQQELSNLNGSHDAATLYSKKVASTLELPFHSDPVVASNAAALRISCERLAQIVTPPRHIVFEAASSFYTTLALQITSRADIATLIDIATNEGKQEGVPVDVLSKRAKLDADLLTRIMRHLSVSGIFQEIAPGVFSNTIASSTMVRNPEFNAHLDLVMHEGQIAAPFFPDLMMGRFAAPCDPNSDAVESDLQPSSAFSFYSHDQPFYAWLHSPSQADRLKIFNLAMRGMSHTEGLAFLPVDYPFSALTSDTLLVDVGGGLGSLPSLILPAVKYLRFVVQDLASVISQAHDTANRDMQRWIAEGKVRFEVQDCFAPQAADKAGAVFILKSMLHNYPDETASKILAAIRPSKPFKLLIIDRIVNPHLRTQDTTAAGESNIYRKLREGCSTRRDNGSEASNNLRLAVSSQRVPTTYDLVMASLHGGRTRTLDEWRSLLIGAGFRLHAVYPLRASTGQAVLEAAILSD